MLWSVLGYTDLYYLSMFWNFYIKVIETDIVIITAISKSSAEGQAIVTGALEFVHYSNM